MIGLSSPSAQFWERGGMGGREGMREGGRGGSEVGSEGGRE